MGPAGGEAVPDQALLMKQRSKGVDGGNFALRGSRGTCDSTSSNPRRRSPPLLRSTGGRKGEWKVALLGGNRRQSGGLVKAMLVNREGLGVRSLCVD